MTDARVVHVAAGLLGDIGTRSVDELRGRLEEVLTPATLWSPSFPGAITPAALRGAGGVAQWRPPPPLSAEQTVAVLDAWRDATAAYNPPAESQVRVTVESIHAARELVTGDVDGLRVSAFIPEYSPEFSWRWPLRVGVAAGPRAAAWADVIGAADFARELFDVTVAGPGYDEPLEILIVDAAAPVDIAFARAPTCVVQVGSSVEPGEARGAVHSSVFVAIARDGVEWFAQFLRELAHDQPVDVAISLAAPGSVVIADPDHVELTAPARWAAAVCDQLDGGHIVADARSDALREVLATRPFDHEYNGSRALVERVRGFGLADGSTTLRRGSPTMQPPPTAAEPPPPMAADEPPAMAADEAPPMAAEPPPPMAAERPPPPPAAARRGARAAPPPRTAARRGRGGRRAARPPRVRRAKPVGPRYLIAEVMRGTKRCTTSLAPHTAHVLEVWIGDDRPESGFVFPDAAVADTPSHVAELTIDVRDLDNGYHEHATVTLSTEHRDAPTEHVKFAFTTGEAGSGYSFTIVVLHQGRPIQKMKLGATVSDDQTTGSIQRTTFALSAEPEPRDEVTAADVSLDFTHDRIVTWFGAQDDDNRRLHLNNVKATLDLIEAETSRVLGVGNAPTSLSEAAATELLIALARLGKQLHDKVTHDLQVPRDARAISMLVRYDSDIIPLELAYDGPAPQDRAKLCVDHQAQPPGEAEACHHAGATVVCPYAFWGMHRVITRTIQGAPGTTRTGRASVRELSLTPVLYAAARKADEGNPPPDPLPSAHVLTTLHQLVGKRRVFTATNWTRWRFEVGRRRPQMLVILGHTASVNQEPYLYVGKSKLGMANIGRNVLARKKAPPPLLVLIACQSAVIGGPFGTLPATFIANGAGAVVAVISKLNGPQGASTAIEIVRALQPSGAPTTLGAALTAARRSLIKKDLLVGLLLVAHGEIDMTLRR